MPSLIICSLMQIRICCYTLKIDPPFASIPTKRGNLWKVSRFTDSQPRSSKAITSHSVMCLQASAPAPPIAHKYSAQFLSIAAATSALRGPFPIMAASPISSIAGANLSIREDVVGPQAPIAMPSFAGVGPA